MKKCLVCEKDFEPKSGKQIFCSDACKMKAARAKKKNPIQDYKEPVLMVSQEFKDEFDKACLRTIPWVLLIEDYCGIIGMTPEELIADHKRMSHLTSSNQTKKMIDSLKNKKTEVTGSGDIKVVNKNDYNPNDNWRYKSKLGKENPRQE